jgi:hypothetical protein
MDQVLFNKDLFEYITKFIPKIYCMYMNTICKNIYEIYNSPKCQLCNNKIFIPIEIQNKLYCYDCYEVDFIDNIKNIYNIDKFDKKNWKYLDKCKKKSYLNCRYCNIKCSSLDFAHYHVKYKCNEYDKKILNIIKLK